MDAEKFLAEVRELLEPEIREQIVGEILADLEAPGPEDEREWAECTAQWLRENYL